MTAVDTNDRVLASRRNSRLGARKVDVRDCTLRSGRAKVLRIALCDQVAVFIVRGDAVARVCYVRYRTGGVTGFSSAFRCAERKLKWFSRINLDTHTIHGLNDGVAGDRHTGDRVAARDGSDGDTVAARAGVALKDEVGALYHIPRR